MTASVALVLLFAASGTAAAAAPPSTPTLASGAPAPSPVLRVEPARARPGDAVLLTVSNVRPADAASVSATVQGRRIRFFPIPGGVQAVAALPVEMEPGTLGIDVSIAPSPTSGTAAGTAAGAASSGGATLHTTLEVVDPAFPETRLSVEPKFIAPSPAQKKRMEEDQAAFREAFARPFEAPLFAGSFERPREAATTGQFGERRTFNGKKQSQHYGTDFAGAVGEPVRAANDGVVALVRDCFASGTSIAIAHGGGLFSVYFHLSDFDVRPGDQVQRGQQIGRVGMTGRVTGPHLHFGVKIGDLYVDPESVYRLAFALPATSGTAPAPTSGTVPGTAPGSTSGTAR